MQASVRQLVFLSLLIVIGVGAWIKVAYDDSMRERFDVRQHNAEHEVVVFVADWCGYCARLQRWLDVSGVPYRALDIERTDAGRFGHGAVVGIFSGVPTTVIGQDVIQGLATDKLRKRLTAAGFTMQGDP